MKHAASLLSLAGLLILGACNRNSDNLVPAARDSKDPVSENAETAEEMAVAQVENPAEDKKLVRLKTSEGDIVIELNAKKAPITVANFLKYVTAGHYDGTVFHRVISDFMIQGGGFVLDGKRLFEKETRKGIKNESQNGLKNKVGTIAMARTRDPNSASAQFFINVTDNDNLNYPSNGGYAVFGKVVEGMDVVNQIRAVATGTKPLTTKHPFTGQIVSEPAANVPLKPVVIEAAEVVK